MRLLLLCHILTLIAFPCLSTPTPAHPKSQGLIPLYGRILPHDGINPIFTPRWYAKVLLRYRSTNVKLDPIETNKDVFCYKSFSSAGVAVIVCSLHGSGTTTFMNVSSNDYSVPVRYIELGKLNPASARLMSDEAFAKYMDAEAKAARENECLDIYHWNLASLTYEDDELKDKVERYIADTRVPQAFGPTTESTRNFYSNIIALNNGLLPVINQSQLLKLIQGSRQGSEVEGKPFKNPGRDTFAGIRAEAILAMSFLSNSKSIQSLIKGQFINFLENKFKHSSDLLFRPCCVALARAGTSKDKQTIIMGLKSPDKERAIACLIALKETKTPDEDGDISKYLSDTEATNPEFAHAAEQYYNSDPTLSEEALPRKYVMKDGQLQSGFEIHSLFKELGTDKRTSKDYTTTDSLNVFTISYPANQEYGVFQFVVDQSGDDKKVIDVSGYHALVVVMKGNGRDNSIDIGLKSVDDPKEQTRVKETFPEVPTEFLPFRLNFTTKTPKSKSRLENLKVVAELAFGGVNSQTYYVQSIYFE